MNEGKTAEEKWIRATTHCWSRLLSNVHPDIHVLSLADGLKWGAPQAGKGSNSGRD